MQTRNSLETGLITAILPEIFHKFEMYKTLYPVQSRKQRKACFICCADHAIVAFIIGKATRLELASDRNGGWAISCHWISIQHKASEVFPKHFKQYYFAQNSLSSVHNLLLPDTVQAQGIMTDVLSRWSRKHVDIATTKNDL